MNLLELPLEDSPFRLDESGPLFVMGCPRSGTTFLADCLAGLAGVEVFVGVLAPPRLLHHIGSMDESPDKDVLMHSVRDIFWQSYWRRVHFRTQRFTQVLQGNERFASLPRTPDLDGRLFCYKEPFLCFAARDFEREFPNARFIHILRDGRDNAASMVRSYPHALSDEVLRSDVLTANKVSEVGKWRTRDGFNFPWWLPSREEDSFRRWSRFGRYLRMWREMTERGSAIADAAGPTRYLEVRYETLVTDPIREGERILAFLGRGASSTWTRRLRSARPDSIGNWSRQAAGHDPDEIDQATGELLGRLGFAAP